MSQIFNPATLEGLQENNFFRNVFSLTDQQIEEILSFDCKDTVIDNSKEIDKGEPNQIEKAFLAAGIYLISTGGEEDAILGNRTIKLISMAIKNRLSISLLGNSVFALRKNKKNKVVMAFKRPE